MGLIDEKKGIFTDIGAYLSIAKSGGKKPTSSNSLSSVNNKNEPIPLMLDILTVTSGSESLQTTFGEVMTKYVRNVTPDLKSELKTQYSVFNSDTNVGGGFSGTGYRSKVKDIDVYGKLRNDPSSNVGGLLYNQSSNDFDRAAYNAIASPGTDVPFNNLLIRYDENTDEFVFKGSNGSQTKGDFINGYVDGLTLVNETEFNSKVFDTVFGSISSTSADNTLENVYEVEKLKATIQKLVEEQDNLEITDDELEELLKLAEMRFKGVGEIEVGCCDIIDGSLSPDQLKGYIGIITGTSDPTLVGNTYIDALNASVTDPSQKELQNKNRETIRDGFFKRILNTIVGLIIEAITSTPQIRALQLIVSGFKNNDNAKLDTPTAQLNNNRNMANCMSKIAKSTINKFLFDQVKKELLKIIVPVSQIVLREKINQFLGIMKSLVS